MNTISASIARTIFENTIDESLKDIFYLIKYQSKYGARYLNLYNGLSRHQLNRLLQLGYKVKKYNHLFSRTNIKLYIIEW